MSSTPNPLVAAQMTGTRAIAKALGCSAMTIVRMIEEGRLLAFQIRGGKSPWRCRLNEIERIRMARSDTAKREERACFLDPTEGAR
jgi:excisionase family DNA binding protein